MAHIKNNNLGFSLSVIALISSIIVNFNISHAQINSHIPDDMPNNIQGSWDAPFNWVDLGLDVMLDNECVDLKWEGFCGGGIFSGLRPKFSFRLPVQVIENVRNVGETLLETPVDNFLRYIIDYELFYEAIEAFVGIKYDNNRGLLSIDENQQRRAGLRVGTNQHMDFGHSHIYSIAEDFTPLILSWLPGYCTNWETKPDFKNDTMPAIMHSRIPEMSEAAMPGASLVTPSDCALSNMASGSTIPGMIDVSGGVGAGVALANKTCASNWGGKLYPLNAHTNAANPFVGDALRSIKAIELAKFMGTPVFPFNKSKDRLKDFYNGSRCIKYKEADFSRFPEENKDKEQVTHYVHYLKKTCCL